MQQAVALGERGLDRLRSFDDPQVRESRDEHFLDAVVHFARPESHFDARQMLFQNGEHTGRVRDVADIHGLPRRSQQQSRQPLLLAAL